ncbi:MAG TPA: hypothetical protein VHA09_04585 [Nitrososphaera sp.]|nr:hypothetical protein [Nitrososphaera sp.]
MKKHADREVESFFKIFVDRSGPKSKCGFAFDTRLDDILAGIAAEYIEKQLVKFGSETLRPQMWPCKTSWRSWIGAKKNVRDKKETVHSKAHKQSQRLIKSKRRLSFT